MLACTHSLRLQLDSDEASDPVKSKCGGRDAPAVIIPVLHEAEFLQRSIDAIINPIEKLEMQLVIVRNTVKPDEPIQAVEDVIDKTVQLMGEDCVTVYRNNMNMGVGQSYNQVWKDPKFSEVPWFVCMNSDIKLGNGALESVYRKLTSPDTASQRLWLFHFFAYFAVRKELFSEVGYFDENMWPVYIEDCEMLTRVRRLYGTDETADRRGGYYQTVVGDEGDGNPQGEGFQHGPDDQEGGASGRYEDEAYDLHERLGVIAHNNRRYLEAKWNTTTEECGQTTPEMFKYPFNYANDHHHRGWEEKRCPNFLKVQQSVLDPANDGSRTHDDFAIEHFVC